MRQPIKWTRPVPAITAVDTGRADSLFRLAAAWRACPQDGAGQEHADVPMGPLFGHGATESAAPVRPAKARTPAQTREGRAGASFSAG